MFKLFAFLCNSTGALYKANTESLLRLLEYVIDYNFNHKPNRKFALVSVKVDGEDLLSNGKRNAKPNGFCFNGNHTIASKERKVESTSSVGSLVFSFSFCANSVRCQHSALVFCQLYRNYIYTLHSQCFIASVAWKTVAWGLR